jgi:Putative esterase
MPAPRRTSRTQIWFDSLGEWSWPGRAAEAVEALPLPPAWVPAFPPALEPAAAGAPVSSLRRTPRTNARLALIAALLSAVVVLATLLALRGPLRLEQLLGVSRPAPVRVETSQTVAPAPLPTLVAGDQDTAGSSIDTASYASAALGSEGLFHVYVPPGFASTTQRYPVLYLLHGNSQPATAFLQIGLQEQLDRLIASHAIPPLIAVMIQGGPGANNWRGKYHAYVLEVQQLVDRMLPTIPTRAGRAIAGDSMGGYGAMNIALGNAQRFSVVESWLGFFNGLGGELKAATPTIEREGLHAFVYGGADDTIANPNEETLEAHIEAMLLYAGRALAANTTLKPPATLSVHAPVRAAR